jgi:hypothetical protein
MHVFRRSQSESDPTPVVADTSAPTSERKGRPTPSRKEAEAAAKARAKPPRTRKEIAAAEKLRRAESSSKIRAAMKSGDERYFLPRDKGPVRRFIRDFVDVRFSFIELMIPLLLVALVLGYSGNTRMLVVSNFLLMGTLVLILANSLILRVRLRRELVRRFPNESLKGTTYYALVRSLQMKFMRLPKARVKIGERLPETYR